MRLLLVSVLLFHGALSLVLHENGALVPEEPQEVEQARALHLEALQSLHAVGQEAARLAEEEEAEAGRKAQTIVIRWRPLLPPPVWDQRQPPPTVIIRRRPLLPPVLDQRQPQPAVIIRVRPNWP